MKKEKICRFILAVIGIFLVGTGVAFNAAAALGNDPVGIMYDGIRNALGLTGEQLGTASNIVNIILCVVVFFTGRHYVNIGTFIYIIPYGMIVDIGEGYIICYLKCRHFQYRFWELSPDVCCCIRG